ncbi:MAG: hypothetical protein QNJ97_23205 [Myxococcota bacterium]|nr:hypothetical protein [Myxococcota bacterium]
MWRAHNREFVFAHDSEKHYYLNALFHSYSDHFKNCIHVHGFCLMGNHTHEVGRLIPQVNGGLKTAVKALGDWMRNAHSRFGMGYNIRHNRQGKVAYDRPKTPEIKDEYEVLKTMFYCDANPVRAGIVAHPGNYKHSSYSFYAYGKKTSYTGHLRPPRGYLSLGKTAEHRRRRYRQLCDLYLRQEGLIVDVPDEEGVEGVASPLDFEHMLYGLRIRGQPLRS